MKVSGDGADTIFRERWGKTPAEGLFFTLHNPDAEAKTVTLEWDLSDFGGSDFSSITEMVGRKKVEFRSRTEKRPQSWKSRRAAPWRWKSNNIF